VLLSLEATPFVDSSGLAWLVATHRRLREAGGKLVLHSIPPGVVDLLKIMSLDQVLNLADDESAKLFLTPGGKYTEADIAANGRLTAMRKFKGFQAKHDANPKPGDRLCPISETKANPLCAWVIGGKTYEFCCPPCVEEFVRMAKETPDDVKDPEAYVKR